MTGIKIAGTGHYLPERVVKNEEYTKFVETSDEWITSRTGISTRHIADGENTWEMGAAAAKSALEKAGVSPEEVGLIICTTVSADYVTPSTACIIQHAVGAVNAACFDLNAACTGFVYALDVARQYLALGEVKTVLVVSAEMMTRLIDFNDRSICVLFGDGAGAAVVQAASQPFASYIHSDGAGYGLIYSKHPPQNTPFQTTPPHPDDINQTETPLNHLTQNGREVYKFATKAMPEAIGKACEKAGITPDQLAWIIPHQANARIVQTAMKNLGLPYEKAYMTISHTGNTSSASIPIALSCLAESGQVKKGDYLCVVGFGAGLTYGAAVFQW